jgi:diaminohydroxyphosphoribosylaminopyrimidine deaminase / 5-amino-6-(5-phosphoribosylamino)uracil reductase
MTKKHQSLPFVTLKLATSLDGRIATSTGASKWITGPQSRERVHQMRADHDCVLTGIGTVLADDPELTARTHPPCIDQPMRAVLDTNQRIPSNARLLQNADVGKVVLFHGAGWRKELQAQDHPNIRRYYVDVLKSGSGGLNLRECLALLHANLGVRRVMVEAGSRVATGFLRAGLVDELVWFRAPVLIGGDGLPAIGDLNVQGLGETINLKPLVVEKVGSDMMETYRVINQKRK